MTRTKDLYIAAHEEMIEEMLEANPNMSEADAYDKTADGAFDYMSDKLLDAADRYNDIAKGN